MEIRQIQAVYWSATGNTDRAVNTIADALSAALGAPVKRISFTRPAERREDLSFAAGDLVVFGMPTYAGRLPNKMLPFVREHVHGNGALAAAVVTFGNRAYDNSLAELCAVLEADGFHTVAGGAFACRHAFTDALADGRPDWDDKRQMEDFIRVCENAGRPLYFSPGEVNLAKGTRIRIIGGPLNGCEGILLKVSGARAKRLVVSIQDTLSVAAEVSPDLIEVI